MKQFIGIDISKSKFDVFIDQKYFNFENNHKGFKNLNDELIKLKDNPLLICEATGGYEKEFIKFFLKNDFPVHLAYANKVRNYAKSLGILAKTDKLDSKVIAFYAEATKAQANKKLSSENEELLRELVKRQRQLIDDRVKEKNRLEKNNSAYIKSSIKKLVKCLDKLIDDIEKQVNELIAKDAKLESKNKILKSVPSVGPRVANSLLALLPKLGNTSHKQLSALMGLAPFNADSGKFKGKKSIRGGRPALRRLFYMSSLTSVRFNKQLKSFYEKLREKGKPAKVALIAVAHKLLILLNSLVKNNRSWQPIFNV